MQELVITTVAQHDILSAIADKTIGGLYISGCAEDACIIAIVDNALIHGQLRDASRDGTLHDDSLVGIFNDGILHPAGLAGLPEINAGPAARKIAVRIIRPVSLKADPVCGILLTPYLQCAIHQYGRIRM